MIKISHLYLWEICQGEGRRCEKKEKKKEEKRRRGEIKTSQYLRRERIPKQLNHTHKTLVHEKRILKYYYSYSPHPQTSPFFEKNSSSTSHFWKKGKRREKRKREKEEEEEELPEEQEKTTRKNK